MKKQPIGGMAAHGLPFSKAMRAGDFIYVSGQVAFDDQGALIVGGIAEQTRQTMANLAAVLGQAGAGLEDVVKINVWLDDARDFATFNATYAKFFPKDAPARSTVQSKLMIDAKIEIDCVAFKPQ